MIEVYLKITEFEVKNILTFDHPNQIVPNFTQGFQISKFESFS